MTWIKTVPPQEDERVAKALQDQRGLYPDEYSGMSPVPRKKLSDLVERDSIVMSHSLIPDALLHSFSAFGAMMSADLPLSRREHEMIAATVSAVNRCHY